MARPKFVRAVAALARSLRLFVFSNKSVESTPSSVSALRLVTFVVLVTFSGDVPVAIVDMNLFAETVPLTVAVVATSWVLSVPRPVMLV